VVKFVQEAVADGAQVIQQQGDAGPDNTSKFFGNRLAHNSTIWTSAIEHSGEHYGQLVVYYRANNLVPPDSRRDQAQQSQQPAPRMVHLKVSDGTVLKATYFAAAQPGPAVLLMHQSNRTRDSWEGVARQLAAAGINTLTVDSRGHGESGGKYDNWTNPNEEQAKQDLASELEATFQYLVLQPRVKRDAIGLGGAGLLGVVDDSVRGVRQHSAEVKSLALLSGETFRPELLFLRQASQLPGLFVMDDNDEYPPTVEAMHVLYSMASNPGKKFVHYSASHDAPWLWYEPFDVGKVPANDAHGTDMFKAHPELPGIIVDWFVTTLIKTPGHAPADGLASAAILNQVWTSEGVARVTQQLMEARRKDPQAQLWPEVTLDLIGGNDHLFAGEPKLAIEIFKLNLVAYPDSADAHENLAEAYLANRRKDLARQYAEKALAMIDSHKAPLSSWSDTEQRRGEVRRTAQGVLKKLNAAH